MHSASTLRAIAQFHTRPQVPLNQSELYGNIGYNMAQAESAINYIIKLDNKKIGINLQEFNNTLSHIKFNNE